MAGFAVSLAKLRRIRARESQPAPSTAHPLIDIREGLVFVWNHPVLRTLAWTSGAWHFLFYGYLALHMLFTTRVLGMTPGVMGTAQMLGGAGILAGSILVKPLSARYGTGRAILVGLCVLALGLALMPAIPPALLGSTALTALVYGLGVFVLDCGAALFFVPYIALRQRVTPDAVLGRMVATMRSLTVASAPLGAVAAGALAERVSARTGLVCVAAGTVLLAVAAVTGTRLRHVND